MSRSSPPVYNANQFVNVKDDIDAFFKEDQKAVDLGGGFEAIPIWQIRRSIPYSREELARGNLLNSWWTPKGADSRVEFAQRCPYVSVDNFCLLYNRDMHKAHQCPQLILGDFNKKNQNLFGVKHDIRGLVLAGGGHVERMSNKTYRPSYSGSIGEQMTTALKKLESGDPTLQAAADKELSEEIGIDKENSRIVTQQLGFFDDMLSEPRGHYLRCIFLRWIEQEPKPSEELKTIVNVPIDSLSSIIKRESSWVAPDGSKLSLELGHDTLIRLIMQHPDTQRFIEKITTFYDQEIK